MKRHNPDIQKAVNQIQRLHSRLRRSGGKEISSVYQTVLLEAISAGVKVLHEAGIDLAFNDSGVTWSRRKLAEAKP